MVTYTILTYVIISLMAMLYYKSTQNLQHLPDNSFSISRYNNYVKYVYTSFISEHIFSMNNRSILKQNMFTR